jgi:arsenate reductase
MSKELSGKSSELTVFHYPGCSTCRKARAWLEAQGIEAKWVHIVESPPSVELLAQAVGDSGEPISKFFNTSGRSYREGNFRERRATMDERACLEALAADGKLIRRPLAAWPGGALVGFNAARWHEMLAADDA